MSNLEQVKLKLKPVVLQRTILKTKITKTFNKLQSEDVKGITAALELIKNWGNDIGILDDKILTILPADNVNETDPDYFENEIESQVSFHLSVSDKVSEHSVEVESRLQESSISNEQIIESLSKLNNDVKLPTLKCNSFSDNDKNKFAFHTFLNQFNNLDSRQILSNTSKLAYLISNLNGKALQLISHLIVN